jgi:hypothetical protein
VDVECVAHGIERAFDLGRRLKVMYRKQARVFALYSG